jgi:uncharacterized cupin superfamily protein
MNHVRVADAEAFLSSADLLKPLGRLLDTTELAVNYYEVEPDSHLAPFYHAHADQEEVFYVLAGELTFAVGDREGPTEEVVVAADETVRFAPGEFQRGRNDGTETVRVVALGGPKESTDVTRLRDCPDCGSLVEHDLRLSPERDALLCVCLSCDGLTARIE